MGLRNQAIRLMRTNWSNKEQLLAEELYVILLTDIDPTTGPVTVDPGNGLDPITFDPTEELDLPDLDLPEFGGNPDETTQEEIPGDDNVYLRRTVKEEWVRTGNIPAQIVSGSGNTYTCTLFPNGHEEDGVQVEGVRQLQIDSSETIPAGSWVTGGVYRATLLEVTKEEVVQAGGTGLQGEIVLSTRTHVKVLSRTHSMQVPVWLSSS